MNERQCQCAACSLFAFKLAAVFDVVAFGQFDLFVHALLYVVHHTTQVAVGNVGGDHDLTFYVFAADGIRAHCRDVRPLRSSAVFFVRCRYRSSGCVSFRISSRKSSLTRTVRSKLFPFSYTWDTDFAGKAHIDEFRKLRQGDAVFGKHFPLGRDDELRAFNLLLHIQVGNAGDVLNGCFLFHCPRRTCGSNRHRTA